MQIELRPLRVFVEVVRQGGFSAAAKTLNSTQSTASKAVKQLEDAVGVPLLNRIGHRTTLTAAGEAVFRRAQKLLAERDDLVAELADLRGLKRGTLRLGLPPIGSSTLFAPLFAIYRQRHPGIEIRLVEHGSDRLEELLLHGDIDLGASLLPVSAAFDWQEVRREPLVAVLPPDHPLAQRPLLDGQGVTFADLQGQPFILFESGFALNRIITDACRRHGYEPEIVARSSQIDFVVELAATGLGIAFLPQAIAVERRQTRARTVQLTEPGIDWHMALVWRRGAYLDHAARAWLEIAAERR